MDDQEYMTIGEILFLIWEGIKVAGVTSFICHMITHNYNVPTGAMVLIWMTLFLAGYKANLEIMEWLGEEEDGE